MLVESLIKSTVELQGFRVTSAVKDEGGLLATIEPDGRYTPRCGACGAPGAYRDTRPLRRFRHVPLWGMAVTLSYAPRRVSCQHCAGVHVVELPRFCGQVTAFAVESCLEPAFVVHG